LRLKPRCAVCAFLRPFQLVHLNALAQFSRRRTGNTHVALMQSRPLFDRIAGTKAISAGADIRQAIQNRPAGRCLFRQLENKSFS
jgi:hypothetical protein